MQVTKYLPVAACVLALAVPGTLMAGKKDDAAGAAAGEKKRGGEMTARAVMKKFDKDQNGKLEGAELDELRNAFGGKHHDRMKAFDKNANGTLEDDEVAAIAADAQAKGGGRKNK